MSRARGKYLIRSIPKLNEFFMGGVGEGTLTHIYGRYQSGKSLLALQILYEWVSSGVGNALVIDSEHSFMDNFGYIWVDRFSRRFSSKVDLKTVVKARYSIKGGKRKYLTEVRTILLDVFEDLGIDVDPVYLKKVLDYLLPKIELKSEDRGGRSIYVYNCSGIEDFASLIGYEAALKAGSKLSVSASRISDPSTSPLSLFMSKYKVKFLFVDSLGGLLKNYVFSLQDYPARAAILNIVLHTLATIADEYGLVVLVSNHESRSPANNFTSFYGGSPVGYGFKYSLYLRMKSPNIRELIGYRSPHLPEAGWRLSLHLSDEGFKEYDKSDKEDV